MLKQILTASAFAVATPACAADLTTLGSWNPASIGYAIGQPIAVGGLVYGVTVNTSTHGGIVYSAKPGSTAITTVFTITAGTSGSYPYGGLAADAAGNLYGTTFAGGKSGAGTSCSNITNGQGKGCGTVYELSKSGKTWKRTVLYKFATGTDGVGPIGNLLLDASGNIYGVTQFGGSCTDATFDDQCGTVFKLTKSGTTYTHSVLYSFKGGSTDGALPTGTIAMDAAGNIYGATFAGGGGSCEWQVGLPSANNFPADGTCGTVFKLTNSGTTYTETLLHVFTDGADGAVPLGGVALDSAGNVYGATYAGGIASANCQQLGESGCGLVYEIAGGVKSNLYSFTGADGSAPAAVLVDSARNVFGINEFNTVQTSCGASAFYCGTVWKLTNTGGAYTEAALHSFANGTDGAEPMFGLGVDTAGNLYGITQYYSPANTVFELTGAGF